MGGQGREKHFGKSSRHRVCSSVQRVFSECFIYLFVFRDRVSCSRGFPPAFYVSEYELEFLILLPPSEGWDDSCAPLHLTYVLLGSG